MKKNKIYLLISIAALICFLGTAALCNQMGEGENEAPTLKLKISEGPIFSEEDGECYYEIEAIVAGIPEPDIEFILDDNVSLLATDKVKVALNDSNDTYVLEANATNSEGTTTASINLSWGCLEETEEEVDEQITELPKEELSDDQLQVLSMFGYPDEYVIVFDEGNNNIRIDIWIFEAMQSSFFFEGGKYSGSEMVITPILLPDNYNIRPEEFVYPMTPDEGGLLIGEDGYQITETNTGIKTIIYGEGIIVCTYNTDDLLVYVSRSKNVEITED
ncbi:MAG: hypothetical protein MUP02_02025 [Actinobacteria bacterium]|nr:hypothetical protein [Actinomycetota bacterium]